MERDFLDPREIVRPYGQKFVVSWDGGKLDQKGRIVDGNFAVVPSYIQGIRTIFSIICDKSIPIVRESIIGKPFRRRHKSGQGLGNCVISLTPSDSVLYIGSRYKISFLLEESIFNARAFLVESTQPLDIKESEGDFANFRGVLSGNWQ